MVKQIELIAIHNIASLYEEINRVFMSGESWWIGPSLDAFHDLLFGGYGALQVAQLVELAWHNIDHSRQALGYQTTRVYYFEDDIQHSSLQSAVCGE